MRHINKIEYGPGYVLCVGGSATVQGVGETIVDRIYVNHHGDDTGGVVFDVISKDKNENEYLYSAIPKEAVYDIEYGYSKD